VVGILQSLRFATDQKGLLVREASGRSCLTSRAKHPVVSLGGSADLGPRTRRTLSMIVREIFKPTIQRERTSFWHPGTRHGRDFGDGLSLSQILRLRCDFFFIFSLITRGLPSGSPP